jgi:hypothetical protein
VPVGKYRISGSEIFVHVTAAGRCSVSLKIWLRNAGKWESKVFIESKGKGKAVPLQAWSGPEGSRKLRFPDFLTTAQCGGKAISLTHRPHLPPGNTPGTYFC